MAARGRVSRVAFSPCASAPGPVSWDLSLVRPKIAEDTKGIPRGQSSVWIGTS
jgi:hypothetical protein